MSSSASSVSITVKNSSECTEHDISAMAQLFSSHYGVWGQGGPAPGKQVRLSPLRLRTEYMFDDKCFVVLAQSGSLLVGHVIGRVFDFLEGKGIWISQLVVHHDWRSRKVASRLLASLIHGFSDVRVVGMATSHPHAVKALEKVLGAKCSPGIVSAIYEKFVQASEIPYITGKPIRVSIKDHVSIIDTRFLVDHTEVNAIRSSIDNWNLGALNDGEEFFVVILKSVW